MRLSLLQKYILRSTYESRMKRFPREEFVQFYTSAAYTRHSGHVVQERIVNAITKSIERLIDKELMVGYGMRTPHKWYIQEVRLTAKGRRQARPLLGVQLRLPIQ